MVFPGAAWETLGGICCERAEQEKLRDGSTGGKANSHKGAMGSGRGWGRGVRWRGGGESGRQTENMASSRTHGHGPRDGTGKKKEGEKRGRKKRALRREEGVKDGQAERVTECGPERERESESVCL